MATITGPVRVRFAPSPTGFLHVGGVRTAMFNWLLARHYGGQFLLRVEDTDRTRLVEGAVADMMQSLRWVGVDWDEGPDIGGPHGPYVQSERHAAGIYGEHAERLLASGQAYMSFVSAEELDRLRDEARAAGVASFRYRGPEREWPLERQRAEAAAGKPFTVRLKVPREGQTGFHDLIRGGDEPIVFDNDELQDLVLLKSDGWPTYHLANVVDDHDMAITHVMRAEEWVSSTPYHVLLYAAFGWQAPAFAHLPFIARPNGNGKLSKRDGDVTTNQFWEKGFLAEAMFNFLALNGWSFDGETEIMSREEIVERFSIERVQPSAARWNPEKLEWMNGFYIRRMPAEELAARLLPFLQQAGFVGPEPADTEREKLLRLVPLIHERLRWLAEAPELLAFFYRGPDAYGAELLIPKKMNGEETRAMLAAARDALANLTPWVAAALEERLRPLAEQQGVKTGQLFGALRIAATGRTVAPPLFDTLEALGQHETLARVDGALALLAA
jgi:glutamyl-tRNA synthetase